MEKYENLKKYGVLFLSCICVSIYSFVVFQIVKFLNNIGIAFLAGYLSSVYYSFVYDYNFINLNSYPVPDWRCIL